MEKGRRKLFLKGIRGRKIWKWLCGYRSLFGRTSRLGARYGMDGFFHFFALGNLNDG